jgi:ABC-type uncharacterized transport system YnjBCD ATPase subunit
VYLAEMKVALKVEQLVGLMGPSMAEKSVVVMVVLWVVVLVVSMVKN